jgi:acetyltransferase-like isoleucine patch superfamily enzyme
MRSLVQALFRASQGLTSRVRNVFYRLLGMRLEGYVWMRAIRAPRQWEDITLEGGCSLDEGVLLLCSGDRRRDKIVVRRGVYINRHAVLDAHESIEVGPGVMIGPFCYLTDADHGTAPGLPVASQPMNIVPVAIEEDAWLGAGVTILKGVRVGRGAIVGAGSVVTEDVPPGSIVAGVPARRIGQRGGSAT